MRFPKASHRYLPAFAARSTGVCVVLRVPRWLLSCGCRRGAGRSPRAVGDTGADAALGTCRKLVIEPAKVALLFDYCPGYSLFFCFLKPTDLM